MDAYEFKRRLDDGADAVLIGMKGGDGEEYVLLDNYVLVDAKVFIHLVNKRKIGVACTGYATFTSHKLLHTAVWEHCHGSMVEPTIDHIDCIRVDNRLANLRNVDMSEQNSNKGMRCDRQPPPEGLAEEGISCLPRGIRYDGKEDKFTLNDHRFVKALKEKGYAVNTSGTKASGASMLDKLRDALVKYVAMYDAYRSICPDETRAMDAMLDRKHHLWESYYAIVDVAVAACPELFQFDAAPKRLNAPIDDYKLAQSLLLRVTPVSKEVHGPKQLTKVDRYVERLDAYVRFKGDYKPVLFDAKHVGKLGQVNWDADDLRIHITPNMRNVFPRIGDVCDGGQKKIGLPEFVYHVLEGNPVKEDYCVVASNQIRHDVRTSNLVYVRGCSKNFKPPSSLRPIFPIQHIPFLPRGVSMSIDAPYKDGTPAYLFVVKGAGKPSRIRITEANAYDVFLTKVRPVLGDDFEKEYSEYVASVESYHFAISGQA